MKKSRALQKAGQALFLGKANEKFYFMVKMYKVNLK